MVLRTPFLRSNPPLSRMDIHLGGLSKRIKRPFLGLPQRSRSKRYRDTPGPTTFAKPRHLTNPKGRFGMFAQCLLLCIVLAVTTVVAQRAPRSFPVEETTIAQIHVAMREHRLTCRELVDAYLKRIDA